MSEFIHLCPHCKNKIACEEEWVGAELECPLCHNLFILTLDAGNAPANQRNIPGVSSPQFQRAPQMGVPPRMNVPTTPPRMNTPAMPRQMGAPQIAPMQHPGMPGGMPQGMPGMPPGMPGMPHGMPGMPPGMPGMPPGAGAFIGKKEIPKDMKAPFVAKLAFGCTAAALGCLVVGFIPRLTIFLGIGVIVSFVSLFLCLVASANKKLYIGFKMFPTPKKILRMSALGAVVFGIVCGFGGGGMYIWCTGYDMLYGKENIAYIKKIGIPYYPVFGQPYIVIPSDVELHYVGNEKYVGKATFEINGVTYTRSIIAFGTHLFVSEITLVARFCSDFNGDEKEAKEYFQSELERSIMWLSYRYYRDYDDKTKVLEIEEIKVTEEALNEEQCRIEVIFNDPVNNEKVKGFFLGKNISCTRNMMKHDGRMTENEMYSFGNPSWEFKFESEMKQSEASSGKTQN